eukprot:8097025-Pyramimonas_sp.AAC.1
MRYPEDTAEATRLECVQPFSRSALLHANVPYKCFETTHVSNMCNALALALNGDASVVHDVCIDSHAHQPQLVPIECQAALPSALLDAARELVGDCGVAVHVQRVVCICEVPR